MRRRFRLPRRYMDAEQIALVTPCLCGHPVITHHRVYGCGDCACVAYQPDDHFHTLGFLVGVS